MKFSITIVKIYDNGTCDIEIEVISDNIRKILALFKALSDIEHQYLSIENIITEKDKKYKLIIRMNTEKNLGSLIQLLVLYIIDPDNIMFI